MVTLGIDAGTQSIKTILYDSEKKEIIAVAQEKIPLISKEGGVREQEASWWVDALSKCFESLGKDALHKVSALSVSGQQHGFVPLSKDGKVLTPVKLWCDTSTAKECDEMMSSYGGKEKLIENVGNPIMPGYTASKILHLKKANRRAYDEMACVMLPHDYLNYWLSGEVVMERGDASGTGLLNVHTSSWDEGIVNAIGPELMGKLPSIAKTPTVIGRIRNDIASRFGFAESCSVCSGGGDNMMAAIGTGTVSDGDVTMSLGTSGTLFSSTSKPLSDKKGRLAAFSSSHGTWLPLLCTMNCTVATEEMRSYMKLSAKQFDECASKAEIGSDGLVFLPFLNGERVPNLPHGEGVFGGIRPGNFTNENIARSVIEGVSYEFLLGLDAFKELGVEAKVISLTGGGSNSPFWRQLISDITALPVRVPSSSEGGAFGAALQALWIMEGGDIKEVIGKHLSFDEKKSCQPDVSKHEKYMEAYGKWNNYVASVTQMFS